MTLPQYKELDSLKNENEIDQEIYLVQKSLFDLRIKRATNQTIKPHLKRVYLENIETNYKSFYLFIKVKFNLCQKKKESVL
jgi:ribosomal protein L29